MSHITKEVSRGLWKLINMLVISNRLTLKEQFVPLPTFGRYVLSKCHCSSTCNTVYLILLMSSWCKDSVKIKLSLIKLWALINLHLLAVLQVLKFCRPLEHSWLQPEEGTSLLADIVRVNFATDPGVYVQLKCYLWKHLLRLTFRVSVFGFLYDTNVLSNRCRCF